jgi:hypothetical protein
MDENDDIDEPSPLKGEYLQTEPRFMADLRLRFGKWLEERGW